MEEKQENNSTIQEMTAGEMLRNARTTGRRKREISTISKMLCIKEEFLTALEEGNYRVIPEDVYILGFARSYAVELGLNPDEVIAKLKRELGLMAEEKEDEDEEEIVEETEKTNEEDKTHTEHKSFLKKYWMWLVGGLLVLTLVVVSTVMIVNSKTNAENADSVATVETVDADAPKEISFKARVAATYPESKRFDINESRIAFQAVDRDCWVQLKEKNGDIAFSRVLLPGDVFYVNPNANYKAMFGNIGAVDFWVDGHLIKKLGNQGERKEISLSPDVLKSYGFAE